MKSESRILIMKEFKDCQGHRLTFYVIMRGEKGIEHLGISDGDGSTVVKYLRASRLIDEVRIFINLNEFYDRELQRFPEAVKRKVQESLKLLNALTEEVNRLICADIT